MTASAAGEVSSHELAWAQLLVGFWKASKGLTPWPDVAELVQQAMDGLGMDLEHPAYRDDLHHSRAVYSDEELLRVALGGQADLRCVLCDVVIDDPDAVADVHRLDRTCRAHRREPDEDGDTAEQAVG
jgi:hypothetical protein